ncbi:MAG TPA: N-acetyltransferase, partial [Terracidiphilus sp.]|nr:N-acetyltransferase [Terracidiphilus sp.]
EILDLRHFAAALIRPVIEAEGELWRLRLHWDYRTSAKLLMQYLDSHSLPGYAALEAEKVVGYAFCVYEETKAIVGDVFAVNGRTSSLGLGTAAPEVETTLLKHLFETLLNSPQVNRVESQLLLHPSGAHAEILQANDFRIFRRLFMVQRLQGRPGQTRKSLPDELEVRLWREDDLNSASRLIAEAYRGHPDSMINDQYCSVHGSLRFLNNIVRYSGCGQFSPQASHVVVHRPSRELIALILGSRVSPQSGHITQVCVHPNYRRIGLARMLLSAAANCFTRQGAEEISLTVTEANTHAIDLYKDEGYACAHVFDAAVWVRGGKA